jgi:hypothetical protein
MQLSDRLSLERRMGSHSPEVFVIVDGKPLCVNSFLGFSLCTGGYRGELKPSIDGLPPSQSHPLFKVHFGPLSSLPPFRAELPWIIDSRYAERNSRHGVTEDAQSASSVEI